MFRVLFGISTLTRSNQVALSAGGDRLPLAASSRTYQRRRSSPMPMSCASVGVISARVKAARQWIDEGYIAATDGKKVGHRAARFRVTDRRR